jgi:hypothetical protein
MLIISAMLTNQFAVDIEMPPRARRKIENQAAAKTGTFALNFYEGELRTSYSLPIPRITFLLCTVTISVAFVE